MLFQFEQVKNYRHVNNKNVRCLSIERVEPYSSWQFDDIDSSKFRFLFIVLQYLSRSFYIATDNFSSIGNSLYWQEKMREREEGEKEAALVRAEKVKYYTK